MCRARSTCLVVNAASPIQKLSILGGAAPKIFQLLWWGKSTMKMSTYRIRYNRFTEATSFTWSAAEIQGILSISLGIVALGFYLSWWLQDTRLASPWLLLGLIAALFFSGFQLLSNWLFFLLAPYRPARERRGRAAFSVEVFVTACGEEHALVRRCLVAACAMRGEKRVWLLDDGRDPALMQLAAELGAGYLQRDNHKNAKAGNLNAALARTEGEIIAIFDIDHVPAPDYLERTVPYFADPSIGFVQVMLTFGNGDESWVAQAAAESSLDFYNPTSKGMDAVNSVTMMGSNSLIRRTALEAIGNYQPGLAEDLATSVALHAAGWRSVYVAEPLAPGIAPPDLGSWFTQQLKWARGVFEVLLVTFPRRWQDLTWDTRAAYGLRMTMYWLGPVICTHLLLTLGLLLWGSQQALAGYERYLLHLCPLAFTNLLIHSLAMRRWRHPLLPARPSWQAVVLVFATWPLYTLAWIMAVLRVPLAFRLTPKTPTGELNLWWLAPQLASVALLVGATLYRYTNNGQVSLFVLMAVLGLAIPHLLFFWQLLAPANPRRLPNLAQKASAAQLSQSSLIS